MNADTADRDEPVHHPTGERARWGRVTRLEWGTAALAALVLGGLTIAEPDILEAPFENARTAVFTLGGTALAAVALVVMLRVRVHPVARIIVLGAPFVSVSWWLLSPFFIDDVVNDDFTTSIADAEERSAPDTGGDGADPADAGSAPSSDEPALLGAGRLVGLAGHDGSGDAGFFALQDGARVLRLENFDIQNGPDLRLYVVPGADQTDPGDGSLYLGELRGNVGDQTYDLPPRLRARAGRLDRAGLVRGVQRRVRRRDRDRQLSLEPRGHRP